MAISTPRRTYNVFRRQAVPSFFGQLLSPFSQISPHLAHNPAPSGSDPRKYAPSALTTSTTASKSGARSVTYARDIIDSPMADDQSRDPFDTWATYQALLVNKEVRPCLPPAHNQLIHIAIYPSRRNLGPLRACRAVRWYSLHRIPSPLSNNLLPSGYHVRARQSAQ
jgi:hypothetical protein